MEQHREHLGFSLESLELSSVSDQITVLKKRKVEVNKEMQAARKPWKAHASFDSAFWAQASRVESISLERADIGRKISLCQFGGDEAAWRKTAEGKAILEQINARTKTREIYEARANPPKQTRLSTFRKSWLRLFTNAKTGMNIATSTGKRNPKDQSEFRSQLIEKYQAKHETNDWLWCPILQDWEDEKCVKAAHIFPCMHGKAAMDAIFGENSSKDLFAPANGLLMSSHIEPHFDAGRLVIVPDVEDSSSVGQILSWLFSKPREFKVRVLDTSDVFCGKSISRHRTLTFGDLDNRKLKFRSSFRPAARYLYFHYCVQLLRSAWQQNNQGKASEAAKILEIETGKPLWATPGRYLPISMLRALVEELGHEYKPIMAGAKREIGLECLPGRSSSNSFVLELAAAQVKNRQRPLTTGMFDPAESEDLSTSDDDVDWSDEEA